jgi:uncharacterized protein (UPF0332 family)
MSFDWSDFLKLAESLARAERASSLEEAALRSAVSRAYYAAFCLSRNYARDRGRIALTGQARDHGIVKDYFKYSRVRDHKKIGTKLDRLRDNRNCADYDDDLRGNLRALTQFSLAEARDILGLLDRNRPT